MSTLPVISIKGLKIVEKTHEKYGVTKEIMVSGKSGAHPRINVEVDGVLHSLSLGSVDTGKVDAEGKSVWAPVLRLQEVKASVPKSVDPKTFNTSKVAKAPSAPSTEELQMFNLFQQFLRANAGK